MSKALANMKASHIKEMLEELSIAWLPKKLG